jgi:hypothetical protein
LNADSCQPLARPPLPKAEIRGLGQGVTDLTGEHGDLAPVVRVMGDEVADEGGGVGLEALDPDAGCQRGGDKVVQQAGGLFQGTNGLWDGEGVLIERFGNGGASGCLEPHDVYRVDVRGECGKVAPFSVGGGSSPGLRVEIFEQIASNAEVDVQSANEGLRGRGSWFGGLGQGAFSVESECKPTAFGRDNTMR